MFVTNKDMVQLLIDTWPIRQIAAIGAYLCRIKQLNELLVHKARLRLCIESVFPKD